MRTRSARPRARQRLTVILKGPASGDEQVGVGLAQGREGAKQIGIVLRLSEASGGQPDELSLPGRALRRHAERRGFVGRQSEPCPRPLGHEAQPMHGATRIRK